MRKHTIPMQLLLVLSLLALVVFISCEKKTEDMQDEVTPDNLPADTSTSIVPPAETELEVEEEILTIPDVTGKWTGTFDKRSTTLNITGQTDSSFSGKISISYREAINQEIIGTISPTTLKMSMKDQLHSRFRGRYNGKLSENGKDYSGTFTMDLDGKEFSFNLNKK